jgi:MFS family permease
MSIKNNYALIISGIVALGGFLLGFDSALISGVIPFIRDYFVLNEIELGWSVSSVLFGSVVGTLFAGPVSLILGRKKSLLLTAALFTISAITSALATELWFFIVARMIGGFGIGMAILIAPVYIAEISPASKRGRLVSINQLMIVIGISLSFFSNRIIYDLIDSDIAWRWMLGIETFPAILYFFFLLTVPESPRWLILKGRDAEAEKVMRKIGDEKFVVEGMAEIRASLESKKDLPLKQLLGQLFTGNIRYFLVIGIILGMLQQFTGINSIFYYAPEIFEKAGNARDNALMQAIIIGLVNLVFTIIAMGYVDKAGRRKLLLIGATGMAIAHLTLAFTFRNATYEISEDTIKYVSVNAPGIEKDLAEHTNIRFNSKKEFVNFLEEQVPEDLLAKSKLDILKKSIELPGILVLSAIILFVAAFAISIGPVMWVLLSEIFPNHVRGLAISVAGFFNGIVSFLVTLLFPWLLDSIGESTTFFIFSGFMIFTFIFVKTMIPETKGKSLEEIEKSIVKI